jgi:hypothetical protein
MDRETLGEFGCKRCGEPIEDHYFFRRTSPDGEFTIMDWDCPVATDF